MSVNIKVTGGLNIEWGQIDPKVTGGLNKCVPRLRACVSWHIYQLAARVCVCVCVCVHKPQGVVVGFEVVWHPGLN